MRISDALAVTWERVNLPEGTILVRIGNTDKWRWKALHPDAHAAFANLPVDDRALMRPAKDVLQERPLGKAINNVKNNGPELLDNV